MPVTNCIKYKGKTYCYDDEKDEVLVFELVALDECPKYVLKSFVKNRDGKLAKSKDKEE